MYFHVQNPKTDPNPLVYWMIECKRFEILLQSKVIKLYKTLWRFILMTLDGSPLQLEIFLTFTHASYFATLLNVSLTITSCGLGLFSSFPLKWTRLQFLRYGWPFDNQQQLPSYTTLFNSWKWREVKYGPQMAHVL